MGFLAGLLAVLKVIVKIAVILYVILFAVFFFDLDGKLLFYVVEPALVKRYDKMKRKDMTKMPYDIDTPNYEYKD